MSNKTPVVWSEEDRKAIPLVPPASKDNLGTVQLAASANDKDNSKVITPDILRNAINDASTDITNRLDGISGKVQGHDTSISNATTNITNLQNNVKTIRDNIDTLQSNMVQVKQDKSNVVNAYFRIDSNDSPSNFVIDSNNEISLRSDLFLIQDSQINAPITENGVDLIVSVESGKSNLDGQFGVTKGHFYLAEAGPNNLGGVKIGEGFSLKSASDNTKNRLQLRHSDADNRPIIFTSDFNGTKNLLSIKSEEANEVRPVISVVPLNNMVYTNLGTSGAPLRLTSSTPISVNQPIKQTYYRFTQKVSSSSQVSLVKGDEKLVPMELTASTGLQNCLQESSGNYSSDQTLSKRGIKVLRAGYYLISGMVRFSEMPSDTVKRVTAQLRVGNFIQLNTVNTVGVPTTITTTSVVIPPYPVYLEANEYVGLEVLLPYGASANVGKANSTNDFKYTSLVFQLIG